MKKEKDYFDKVKKGDKVFGLVYGAGVVDAVWENGFYTFEVSYKNGQTVPYTPEGFPAWSTGKLDFQTVFYKREIDLMDYDFAPSEKTLSVKRIIKLRDKKKLEAKCPSGIWSNIKECPNSILEEYLEEGKLHLFRKEK